MLYLKDGVGHIYQQIFIDTYTKVTFCKLYDRKNIPVATNTVVSNGHST
jgi:hypothetical protein